MQQKVTAPVAGGLDQVEMATTNKLAWSISIGLTFGLAIACDLPDKDLGDETASAGGDGSASGGGPSGECEPGDEMPAGDGCNTCTCEDDGTWACTLLGCEPCEDGNVMPGELNCGMCTCIDGGWSCEEGCQGCEPGDEMPADDGCNTCICDEYGNWACTEIACEPPSDPFAGPEVVACDPSVPMDEVLVENVTLDGDSLTVDVAYGGGCELHLLGGCWDMQWAESDPVQTGLAIAHDGMNDFCEAFLSDQVVLDLGPIATGYLAAYGGTGGTVHINLEGWPETIVYTF
jgi:hypothetical protein